MLILVLREVQKIDHLTLMHTMYHLFSSIKNQTKPIGNELYESTHGSFAHHDKSAFDIKTNDRRSLQTILSATKLLAS
jgi:hypothetical protein